MQSQQPRPTLLIVGAGGLGRSILLELCRSQLPVKIFATARSQEALRGFLSLTEISAAALGHCAVLEAESLDLADFDRSAATIDSIKPDLIVMTATRQSWWLPQLLPDSVRRKLSEAGYGLWLPVHFDLTQRLMRILRHVRPDAPVLTASYPDVTNVILGRLDLAPLSGFGNVQEIVAQVRLRVARHFRVSLSAVRVLLAAHHSLQVLIQTRTGTLPPFAVQIDVEGQGRLEEPVARRFVTETCKLPSGPQTHLLTAACAVRLIQALLGGAFPPCLHAPGPAGLPGGYPVRLEGQNVGVQRIAAHSLEELVRINERSHAFDGIEAIQDDGTVVFNSQTCEAGRTVLGYDCARFQPAEAAERADELIDRFRDLAAREGVDLRFMPREI